MNFKEYITWRFAMFIQKFRACDTCCGSDGHCDQCNEYHHLYRKDYQKVYQKKKFKKKFGKGKFKWQ